MEANIAVDNLITVLPIPGGVNAEIFMLRAAATGVDPTVAEIYPPSVQNSNIAIPLPLTSGSLFAFEQLNSNFLVPLDAGTRIQFMVRVNSTIITGFTADAFLAGGTAYSPPAPTEPISYRVVITRLI
jgi:hypothetical protein